MATSTDNGEDLTPYDDGLGSAADAFFATFKKEDAEEPSSEDNEATTSESEEGSVEQQASDESPEDSGSEEQSDETEQQPETKKYVDSDDAFVKVKVGDQEDEVPVKDLKRLYGQEASLTRKSQEVAEIRKQAEAASTQHAAAIDYMLQRATARANEFRQVNFLALTKDPNITPEQLGILQEEARKAFEEERFLSQELNNFVGQHQQRQQQELAKRAAETIKTLSTPDSPHYIEGWGDKVYGELRDFAVSEGLDKDIVNNLVDAPALKLLHMAMMYKKGASKVSTVKTNKTPKKIVKTSNSPPTPQPKSAKKSAAMQTLKRNGSIDDAANAFLASWADD